MRIVYISYQQVSLAYVDHIGGMTMYEEGCWHRSVGLIQRPM
jgi:hypothetical protein